MKINSLKNEAELAAYGTLGQVRAFIDQHLLDHEAQIALVKRGENAVLREYASRFKMCEKAQVELAKQRNYEILLIQAENHNLCREAVKVLLKGLNS